MPKGHGEGLNIKELQMDCLRIHFDMVLSAEISNTVGLNCGQEMIHTWKDFLFCEAVSCVMKFV